MRNVSLVHLQVSLSESGPHDNPSIISRYLRVRGLIFDGFVRDAGAGTFGVTSNLCKSGMRAPRTWNLQGRSPWEDRMNSALFPAAFLS